MACPKHGMQPRRVPVHKGTGTGIRAGLLDRRGTASDARADARRGNVAATFQKTSFRQYNTSAAPRCGGAAGVEPSLRTNMMSVDGATDRTVS